MSEVKFTPGPWEWVGAGLETNVPSTILDCGEFTAARPSEANARLIAAAPDGFAAAQDALIALEAAPDTVTTRIARQKLRAFIAKATGEQQ